MKTGTLVKQKFYSLDKFATEDPVDVYRYGIVVPLDEFFASNVKNSKTFVRVFWQTSKELSYSRSRLNLEVVKIDNLEIVKEAPSYVQG